MTAPNLPAALVDGFSVTGVRAVSGGDVAEDFQVDTIGGPVFVKVHRDPRPAMFEREARGLRALRNTDAVAIPEVLRQDALGLTLEWIEPGSSRGNTFVIDERFGRELAALHTTSNDTFGGLDGDDSGYLGSQPVDLRPTGSWVELFYDRRVVPLTRRAVELGRLRASAVDLVDGLAPREAELCGAPEPPALVHGDLWAGNRLVDQTGRSWLIDPSAHWGHRELDLAMMQLFGGFGPATWAAYDEAQPLAPGWRDRVGWYQLPPLLVHAIRFGGSYASQIIDVLRRVR
ncbi:fructosamine kinase family protein [soil metagenome]